MGLREKERDHLRSSLREERREDAEDKLIEAGAHLTVRSFADLPELIGTITQRLDGGECPS